MDRKIGALASKLEKVIATALKDNDLKVLAVTCIMGVLFLADALFILIIGITFIYVLVSGAPVSFGLRFWVYLAVLALATAISCVQICKWLLKDTVRQ